jgi:hypothetical protein
MWRHSTLECGEVIQARAPSWSHFWYREQLLWKFLSSIVSVSTGLFFVFLLTKVLTKVLTRASWRLQEPDGKSKGFGFVNYEEPESAAKVSLYATVTGID